MNEEIFKQLLYLLNQFNHEKKATGLPDNVLISIHIEKCTSTLSDFYDFYHLKQKQGQHDITEIDILYLGNKLFLQALEEKKDGKLINPQESSLFHPIELEFYGSHKQNIITDTDSIEIDSPLTLFDVFKSPSKYQKIMDILINQGYCQAGTFIWKDERKGNKSLLVSILKFLHIQGYYKEDKKLKNKQIKAVAKNTFGMNIGDSIIGSTKPDDFKLGFIPPSSTF